MNYLFQFCSLLLPKLYFWIGLEDKYFLRGTHLWTKFLLWFDCYLKKNYRTLFISMDQRTNMYLSRIYIPLVHKKIYWPWWNLILGTLLLYYLSMDGYLLKSRWVLSTSIASIFLFIHVPCAHPSMQLYYNFYQIFLFSHEQEHT